MIDFITKDLMDLIQRPHVHIANIVSNSKVRMHTGQVIDLVALQEHYPGYCSKQKRGGRHGMKGIVVRGWGTYTVVVYKNGHVMLMLTRSQLETYDAHAEVHRLLDRFICNERDTKCKVEEEGNAENAEKEAEKEEKDEAEKENVEEKETEQKDENRENAETHITL